MPKTATFESIGVKAIGAISASFRMDLSPYEI
jgi:hypothetical protein